MHRLLGTLTALAFLAACGGDDDSSPTTTVSDGELRPADDVISEEDAEASVDVDLGEAVDLGGGLEVTVSAMSVGGDDGGPWLEVEVRAENRGEDGQNPNMAIVCAGGAEEGGWQAESTFELGGDLPSGSFNEGIVNLLLPEDSRTGEATPECKAPAFIRVSSYVTVTIEGEPEPVTADYPLAPEVLEELNSNRLQDGSLPKG